ncbi:hypothetical protein VNO80_27566 [Phaseolus coccineus]|uniref:Senescence regulator n=1 Tax=Phaseolus coccineus TaxID=3886 RepID=A0AAN9LGJ1_PHACN
MDLNDPNRFRNRKPTLSPRERFLGVPSNALGFQNPSSSTAATGTEDENLLEDLLEDDVVFSNNDDNNDDEEDSAEPSSPTPPIPNHSHSHNAFGRPDVSLGIRAALPENDHPSPNTSHFFHHKISVSLSSFSSSSARLIPVIRKPPQHRFSSSSVKFYQSAPVNSRFLPKRRRREFMEDDAVVVEERLPPHEIVARNLARRPVVAYSVLEGVGRTLKGRDLRQVRNAVLRKTGFLHDIEQ